MLHLELIGKSFFLFSFKVSHVKDKLKMRENIFVTEFVQEPVQYSIFPE